MSDVTRILNSYSPEDPKAAEELLPLVYEELRKLGASRMTNEKPGQTIQATALVHEAWLRLAGEDHDWSNRRHFFSSAAEAMRRILIERARKKLREKHGSRLERVALDSIDIASEEKPEVVDFVNTALETLKETQPVTAELIKLRFFAGVPNEEAARILGLSDRTARRNWAYARAWLADELNRLKSE